MEVQYYITGVASLTVTQRSVQELMWVTLKLCQDTENVKSVHDGHRMVSHSDPATELITLSGRSLEWELV